MAFDINNPSNLNNIRLQAKDLIRHGLDFEVRKLADQLEDQIRANPDLATKNQNLYVEYLKTILWLKLSAFSVYDNDTCLNLIKRHFVDVYKLGLDLNQLMNAKMYTIPDLAWPDFAQECIRALKANEQRIGQQPLEIQGETIPKAPTVQNWLIDYDRTFNADKHSDLEQNQYLSQNKNARKLEAKEREWLTGLLRFYDNLKPISLSLLEKMQQQKSSTESSADTPSDTHSDISSDARSDSSQNIPSYQNYTSSESNTTVSNNNSQPLPPLNSLKKDTSATNENETENIIEDDDELEPPKPQATSGPRLDGNIVDLKSVINDNK